MGYIKPDFRKTSFIKPVFLQEFRNVSHDVFYDGSRIRTNLADSRFHGLAFGDYFHHSGSRDLIVIKSRHDRIGDEWTIDFATQTEWDQQGKHSPIDAVLRLTSTLSRSRAAGHDTELERMFAHSITRVLTLEEALTHSNMFVREAAGAKARALTYAT